MNSFGLIILINIFLLSVISISSVSPASFPSPPQKPPPDASPDEQALFWKLLHNYYAILARPRFGKRANTDLVYSKSPLYWLMFKRQSIPTYSSEQYMDYAPNTNRFDVNSYNSFEYPDQQRRR